MPDYLSISKQKPAFPQYLNFQVLRDIGIKRLQALSSDLWTDYNLHDPGVTILEVLCYAITDLGYRNNFEIQDLLALNPQDSNSKENNFFTPDELLTCNPVTDLDLRKRIIDIPGVRNVHFEKVGVPKDTTGDVAIPYEPAIAIDLPNRQLRYAPEDSEHPAPRLHPRGLYTVCLDLDSQYRTNSCNQLTRDWSGTIDEVKQVLCSTRSLCEDIYDIELLGEEEIGLCADIQLESGADAEDVLVEIYVKIQAFLSPRLRFYTLQELLQKGKSPADIFAGRPMALDHGDRPYGQTDRAYDSHGFIDTEELAALTPPTVIQTSDLYQVILDVPGVTAVQKLSIANYINGLRQSQGHPWTHHLTEGYRPILGIQQSIVKLYLDDLPTPVNTDEVVRRYYEQQAAYIKAIRDPYELDLAVPKGRHYNLADYYSIHHEFPLTYGIGKDGLPDSDPALRKVQAQQLKGYLVFFDQLLANYLSQLSHVRELFSWELGNDEDSHGNSPGDNAGGAAETEGKQQTYFSQALDFPGIEHIIKGMDEDAPAGPEASYLKAIAEDAATYRDRRGRFLDHLLARFSESFNEYVLLNYQLFEQQRSLSREQFEQQILRDKARFVQNYPLLSHDRFRAFNYCDCDAVWNSENVAGFERRVASLLGFRDNRRRDLNHYRIEEIKDFVLSVQCHASAPALVTPSTYGTEAEALNHRDYLLLFLLHPSFYAQLTYTPCHQDGLEVSRVVEGAEPHFGYALKDVDDIIIGETSLVAPDGQALSEGTDRFISAAERDLALKAWFCHLEANQNNFEFRLTSENDCWKFHLTSLANELKATVGESGATAPGGNTSALENNTGEDSTSDSTSLTFTSKCEYPTPEEARADATLAAGSLRYRSRYLEAVGTSSVHITDGEGEILMTAKITQGANTVFRQLNNLDDFLRLETVEIPEPAAIRYRYGLVDRLSDNGQRATLLQSMETYPDETTARTRFYQDVVAVLFEPGVISPTENQDGFGFRLLSQPRDLLSEVAENPQPYATEAERDDAIDQLFLLVRTARYAIATQPLAQALPVYPGKPDSSSASATQFRGKICPHNGPPLLHGRWRFTDETTAWEQGNTLMELVQEPQNFRTVEGDGIYGWELTNPEKDQVWARRYHCSAEERTQSMDELRRWANDEGFYGIEHILLRPRSQQIAMAQMPEKTSPGETSQEESIASNVPPSAEPDSSPGTSHDHELDKFLPIIVKPDDAQYPLTDPDRLARQDPYSFWVTVVLPYWPKRFRNIDFRRFVERTLRLEAPAPVALKIAWVNGHQFHQVQTAYRYWLEQFAQYTCQGTACDLTRALNQLLEILPQLRNVYPKATLHNCAQNRPGDSPILLNRTAIGNANE